MLTHTHGVYLYYQQHYNKQSARQENNHCCGQVNNSGTHITTHVHWHVTCVCVWIPQTELSIGLYYLFFISVTHSHSLSVYPSLPPCKWLESEISAVWLMAPSCLKSRPSYRAVRLKHTNTIVLHVVRRSLKTDHYLPSGSLVHRKGPTLKRQEMKTWLGLSSASGDDGIRGGCVSPYRCLWGESCDRRGRKRVLIKSSPGGRKAIKNIYKYF